MTTGLLNPSHIILLLLVVLIILGPKRLPQAGRSIWRGMREFKEGISGQDDTPEQTQEYTAPAAPAALARAPPRPAAPATATAQQPAIATNTGTAAAMTNWPGTPEPTDTDDLAKKP